MVPSSSSVFLLVLFTLFAFFFVAANCALPQSLIDEESNNEWIAVATKRISAVAASTLQQRNHPFAIPSLGDAPLPNCTMVAKCVKKGSQCDSDIQFLGCFGFRNSSARCCSQGLYCLNGTCQTDNFGANCTSSEDCYPSLDGTQMASCINDTCTEMYNTNDYCESDDVCLSGSCTSGRCEGIAIGQACNPNFGVGATCVVGASCLKVGAYGMCVKSGGSGTPCTDQYVPTVATCEPGLICVSGTCAEFNTIPSGHSCDPGTLLECEEGLACGAGSTCVNGSDFKGQTCSNNTDCGSNYCQCSPWSGQNFCAPTANATNCQTEMINLYDCLTQNNCSYSVGIDTSLPQPNRAPDSCTMKNCKSEYIAQRVCTCATIGYAVGNCYYDYYCSKIATWIIIVIIIAGVVLLVLLAICIFLCCRCCRRRSHYDQI